MDMPPKPNVMRANSASRSFKLSRRTFSAVQACDGCRRGSNAQPRSGTAAVCARPVSVLRSQSVSNAISAMPEFVIAAINCASRA
jgi:hypothetical protein